MSGSPPLAGVTVLDLTRLLPGGYCTLLLSDLGADVIKVEEPGRGDYIRWIPPLVDGQSTAHRAINRGKRSIAINLKAVTGPGLLRRLAGAADVLVESFRPGVMGKLGLGWETLSRDNPRLVYCSITGFGQSGPYRDLVGHDINYAGYGGVLSMTGPPGGPPTVPGVQVADLGGGMMAATGILAALVARGRGGGGRYIDASMLDAAVSWLSVHAGSALVTGEPPAPGGGLLTGGLACYRIYRAGDGRYLAVGALEPRFWKALCEALGCTEFVDEQFGPQPRQEDMAERLQEIFSTKGRDEWVAELMGVEACVGPVNDVLEALADPQVLHRGMLAEVEGVPVGPGAAPAISGHRPDIRPAPGLGDHTAEVLGGIGISDQEIAELRSSGAL